MKEILSCWRRRVMPVDFRSEENEQFCPGRREKESPVTTKNDPAELQFYKQ